MTEVLERVIEKLKEMAPEQQKFVADILDGLADAGAAPVEISPEEQAIVDRGYREIRIETASILTAAVKLYESNGYQPISEVETARCDRAYVKQLTVDS